MIARIATFSSLTPETAAESRRNLLERFLPALKAQEGFVGGYWLRAEDGRQLSITVWESEEALRRGGAQANAVPLLPGQDPSKIPSPDHVESFEVVAIA
jgi:heme-degrading monooxygenase HmoA